MRILEFSEYSNDGFGTLSFFKRGFEDLGHSVEFFQTNQDRSNNIIIDKAKQKINDIFQPKISNKLVRDFTHLVNEYKPEVALTSLGGMSDKLPIEFLEILTELKIPIFCYFTDPVPEENQAFLSTIPLYRGIFTYNRHYIPTWYWYGANLVKYLPFASDHLIHKPKKPPKEKMSYYHSPIAYLGTWQPNAERWPSLLTPYGLKVWGNQWSKIKSNNDLMNAWQGEDQGTNEDFTYICSASNIIFNFVRAFNGQGHSMKTFEIPACKGFAITNRTNEQLEFFPEDEACVYFSTEEELIDKVEFYLNNEEARKPITECAYKIAKNHTYRDRCNLMIKYFNEST